MKTIIPIIIAVIVIAIIIYFLTKEKVYELPADAGSVQRKSGGGFNQIDLPPSAKYKIECGGVTVTVRGLNHAIKVREKLGC